MSKNSLFSKEITQAAEGLDSTATQTTIISGGSPGWRWARFCFTGNYLIFLLHHQQSLICLEVALDELVQPPLRQIQAARLIRMISHVGLSLVP